MEWNRRNLLLIVVLLAIGFGTGGVMYVRAGGGVNFTAFRIKKWIRNFDGGGDYSPSPSEIRRARYEAVKVKEKVWKLYPELKAEAKLVSDERNGFLAIIQIKDDPRMSDLLSSEIASKMSQDVLDVPAIQTELSIHLELLIEIERIAALPERSSENMPADYNGLIPARELKVMCDYLVFKARIAATQKNEDEAFRYLSLTMNLVGHVDDVEKPTFLSETVLILVRTGSWNTVMKYILPEIGQKADLAKWRELLKPRGNMTDRYVDILKGEFNYLIEQYVHMFFLKETNDALPDPEAFCLSYAACVVANMKAYRGMNFVTFATSKPVSNSSFTKGLSKESVDSFSILSIGKGSWNNGMLRANLVEAHFDAAMDLLIREKAGEDLSKLTETYVLNPLTGKPFVFDPVKRVLPEDPGFHGDPLDEIKLPW